MDNKELDLQKAKEHLDTVRMAYTEVGAPGMFALRITIDPLLIRYERGERSEELYNEIMELEL